LRALCDFFVGRRDTYLLQQPNGSYVRIEGELGEAELASHCQGYRTVACYLTNKLGNTPVGVYDIDSKESWAREAVLILQAFFSHWGIHLPCEETGGRGYHLWLVCKGFVPAPKVRRLLLVAFRQAFQEPPRIEVLPMPPGPRGFDHPIRLPFGRHRVTGRFSRFVDASADFMPCLDDLDGLERAEKLTEARLDEVLSEYPNPEEEAGERGPGHTSKEVLEMLCRPLGVGERRPTLVSLAGYLRYRGIPEEVALALLLPWAERAMSVPLPRGEVERHIRGIYHRYGHQQGHRWKEVPL